MAISLSKGQKVSLVKEDGSKLTNICIGLNWGAIKGMFGHKAVDLDASVGLFTTSGTLTETVYFGNLTGANGAVKHSGDDRVGDTNGDDGLDNEVIVIDLARLKEEVSQIAFVLDSYNNIKFDKIPHASIRIYEGTPGRVDNVLATFDIANDSGFSGAISMIMGKVYRHGSDWKFNAIGEPTRAKKLAESLDIFKSNYL